MRLSYGAYGSPSPVDASSAASRSHQRVRTSAASSTGPTRKTRLSYGAYGSPPAPPHLEVSSDRGSFSFSVFTDQTSQLTYLIGGTNDFMSDTEDEEPKPFPWARIPLEIAREIVGHSTKDVASLRALALASKGTRFLAVEHLFSVVHFACSENFPRWLDMLSRTPILVTLVKRVKFSQSDASWLRRHRGPNTSKLDVTTVPPLIPLPNVSTVEWFCHNFCVDCSNLRKAAAAWAHLFPSVRRVHVENLFFNGLDSLADFLAAFGNLKALSLVNIQLYDSPDSAPGGPPQPSTFNLAEVEDLAITASEPYDLDAVDPILYLLQQSPPTGLKSLDIGGFGYGNECDPCSVLAMERLLSTSASSLVNLIIEPTFTQELLDPEIIRMAGRLPVLHALQTLTVWLRHDSRRYHRSNHHSNHQVEQVLKALQAPNLTTIIFRIRLYEEGSDGISELLDKVLDDFLPWDNSPSLKSALTQKFPLIQRLGFHFDVPHSSEVHLRRSCRRKLEKQLRGHLERAGDDVADYLPVEWLDVDDGHSVVVYSKITGKAPWSVPRAHRPWQYREPDTEGSDWESDKSDSGWDSDRPRVWTEADERSYQIELREEAYGPEWRDVCPLPDHMK